MFSLSSFVLPLSLALVPLALWTVKPLFIPRTRTHKHATQIQQLLNPPGVSLGSLLQARAAPNQRLVHAFGLTNTFVSADTDVHKTFTTQAKALVAGAGDEDAWRTIAQGTEATTHRFLPAQHGDTIDFATLIQSVTFSVVLAALFGTDLDSLVFDDVVYVTKLINQRWEDSKIKEAAAMAQDDSLHHLLEYIDRWVTDHDQYPNPMNFILPAYETLWRVVAVSVGYVYRFRDSTAQDAIMVFGRNPTKEQFTVFGGTEDETQPSMEAIILEVLRLHPPTRHIARAPTELQSRLSWKTLVAPAIEIADIEAVHRSKEYGACTSKFDPMRFHPSRMPVGEHGRPARELYAFGFGKLKCIAIAWAPMAAAVIAAKVVLQIEEARCTVRAGNKIGGRSGWDGWSVGKDIAE